mmetsp:Transcript_12760/g.38987  ORF Transcript_12760/g.38987 Transcript_12760/m.38987 type:complete len:394 (+) Transcript_12760:1062-2243(+)
MKACRLVINGKLAAYMLDAQIIGDSPSTPNILPKSLPLSTHVHSLEPKRQRAVMATHGNAPQLSVSAMTGAPPFPEAFIAFQQSLDANEIAANSHVDIQQELALRLCDHIQTVIRLSSGKTLSSALRRGHSGEHLLPVSAVTASFVADQGGVISSLTHVARGLGYSKLTSFLAGRHMNKCLRLFHDSKLNQTFIVSLAYENGTCNCTRTSNGMLVKPNSTLIPLLSFREDIFHSTIRSLETLGREIVRERSPKRCGGGNTTGAMSTRTRATPRSLLIPAYEQITTPSFHMVQSAVGDYVKTSCSSANACISARKALLPHLLQAAPPSLTSATCAHSMSRKSPSSIHDWLSQPQLWQTSSFKELADLQELCSPGRECPGEVQLPRLPHSLLSDC